MTDYSSQGRTQINNVIDLNSCENHQSIYICLSRESTYKGIAIIQRFDDSKIRDDISDQLRQEFQLELLNEITRLQYFGKLPISVDSVTRKQMIYKYREWKGEDFVFQSIPIAIQQLKEQPQNNSEPEDEETQRVIMDKTDKKKDRQSVEARNQSKTKQRAQYNPSVFVTAKGTILLYTVYNSCDELWTVYTKRMSLLGLLFKASQAAINSQLPIKAARDRTRLALHFANSEKFPLHISQETDIYTLCDYILEQYYNYQYRQYECTLCDSTYKAASSSNHVYNDIFIICTKYQW